MQDNKNKKAQNSISLTKHLCIHSNTWHCKNTILFCRMIRQTEQNHSNFQKKNITVRLLITSQKTQGFEAFLSKD